MKCSLIYMDFEGRSDGRSIKSILSQVAPLKLVRMLSLDLSVSFLVMSSSLNDSSSLCKIKCKGIHL